MTPRTRRERVSLPSRPTCGVCSCCSWSPHLPCCIKGSVVDPCACVHVALPQWSPPPLGPSMLTCCWWAAHVVYMLAALLLIKEQTPVHFGAWGLSCSCVHGGTGREPKVAPRPRSMLTCCWSAALVISVHVTTLCINEHTFLRFCVCRRCGC